MSFVRDTSPHRPVAERMVCAPHRTDLASREWKQLDAANQPADDGIDLRTIASFWILTAVLLAVIAAMPALGAAVHHLT